MSHKLIRIHRNQAGITGLETAIILIAFVVVASVFAYTVLSAGLFSTQKSQEAVITGLENTESTLELRGGIVAYKGDSVIASSIGKVEFVVTNSLKNGEAIDLTPPYALTDGALTSSGAVNPTTIAYSDDSVTVAQTAWTLGWIGNYDSDNLLEANEQAKITVWLHSYNGTTWAAGSNPPFLAANNVDTYHRFNMEVKPPKGAVLALERTTPAVLETVNDLR